MFELLLLLIACPILDLTAARFLQNSGSVLTTQRMHAKPMCPSGQYESKGICCDLCKPGSFAKSLGCTENHKTNCAHCTEGEEYMDKYNFNTACLRCNLCDAEHGLETEKKCTINQNVICRCKPGFFCNSTKPCRHCDPCRECENGIIVENCTQTQNTVCGNKENFRHHWRVLLVAAIVSVGLILCILLHKMRKMPKNPVQTEFNRESYELKEVKYPDIDLSPHIADIAFEMKLNEVKMLVRKLGVHTAQIDGIDHENLRDSSEQKIKLLECWYQKHGVSDAYKTLMTTLRELKFHVTADNIKQKIERELSHSED